MPPTAPSGASVDTDRNSASPATQQVDRDVADRERDAEHAVRERRRLAGRAHDLARAVPDDADCQRHRREQGESEEAEDAAAHRLLSEQAVPRDRRGQQVLEARPGRLGRDRVAEEQRHDHRQQEAAAHEQRQHHEVDAAGGREVHEAAGAAVRVGLTDLEAQREDERQQHQEAQHELGPAAPDLPLELYADPQGSAGLVARRGTVRGHFGVLLGGRVGELGDRAGVGVDVVLVHRSPSCRVGAFVRFGFAVRADFAVRKGFAVWMGFAVRETLS